MFEVRTVYSNIEKVMDLITVHTLLEFLTKNGYDCHEDQVREIFLESFKPKNSRGMCNLDPVNKNRSAILRKSDIYINYILIMCAFFWLTNDLMFRRD